MDAKSTDWRAGPNVCRCCLTEGCYKDISTEYFWMGKREVYAEMLSDTLNVTVSIISYNSIKSITIMLWEDATASIFLVKNKFVYKPTK